MASYYSEGMRQYWATVYPPTLTLQLMDSTKCTSFQFYFECTPKHCPPNFYVCHSINPQTKDLDGGGGRKVEVDCRAGIKAVTQNIFDAVGV